MVSSVNIAVGSKKRKNMQSKYDFQTRVALQKLKILGISKENFLIFLKKTRINQEIENNWNSKIYYYSYNGERSKGVKTPLIFSWNLESVYRDLIIADFFDFVNEYNIKW